MSSRNKNTATKHRYDIESARSVTPRKKIALFSLPPPVFVSALSVCLHLLLFFLSYAFFLLFVISFYLFFLDLVLVLRGQVQVFCLVIKAHAGSDTSSTRRPCNKEKVLGDTAKEQTSWCTSSGGGIQQKGL